MKTFDPGRYYRYDELTGQLQHWAAAYPDLCTLGEIARSGEGRAVWAVTLTNRGTGSAEAKPGYLVDGNTHAGELTGGAAALYTIDLLLTGYGSDPVATELLDTRTIYVIPRIAVDGVELYLTTPQSVRSSPKRYPSPEEPEGLYPEDINGDGLILQMRVVHPDGDWRADDQDPRLMVKREPDDRPGQPGGGHPGAGPYYKLYTEGVLKGWDGKAIPPVRRLQSMDFNRNYPAFWNPEGKQPGAGPYPLSEPETRAVANFILGHPNIGAYVAYHTSGGVLLRPPSYGPDDKMGQADLEGFRQIGDLCTRITGHPCKSTYQAFHFPGQEALVKGADDWAYEHLGVQAFTFELWNPDLMAGAKGYAQVGVKGLMDRSRTEMLADERKRLSWNDQVLGGKGFVDWQPFDHPQLGRVEIGGWNGKRALQNPPEGPLLVEEISKAVRFTFQHALTTPRLAATLQATPLGAGLFKLSACIRNTGGLATNVTDMALTMKRVQPIQVRLDGAARILSGQERQELEHLEGWAVSGGSPARQEAWVDWVVQGAPGASVRVTVETPRAGCATAEVKLSGR